jgi:hypothetical protein
MLPSPITIHNLIKFGICCSDGVVSLMRSRFNLNFSDLKSCFLFYHIGSIKKFAPPSPIDDQGWTTWRRSLSVVMERRLLELEGVG